MLSPNDTLARAVLTSVKAAGKPLPVITGQDSEVESVKSILAGEQYSTINKDTRKLVEHAITMVKDIQAGKKPEMPITGFEYLEKIVHLPFRLPALDWPPRREIR